MNGVILVDKPYHYSAFQTLAFVRNITAQKQCGHGGTLDPLAVGMLPICLGESRRFCGHLLSADKQYTVKAHIGRQTTTGDREGAIIAELSSDHLTAKAVEAAMHDLTGVITQTPPMYSAIKHQGKPLYDYARAGIDVQRPSREVVVKQFTLLSWKAPYVEAVVQCSKGTYIRTLLDQLGHALGVGGASLTYLARDWVSPFVDYPMVTLETLAHEQESGTWESHPAYISLERLFASHPQYRLTQPMALRLAYGQGLTIADWSQSDTEVALYYEASFMGLATILSSGVVKVRRLRQSIVQTLCG
jgi:tRNA pseudouridine55 synthase